MAEALRTILLVALAAAALTTLALWLGWWMESGRRLNRAMLRSLGRAPDTAAVSPGEGRAAGMDFEGGQVAVLWNRGANGLVYDFDEVDGCEMIVDGHVIARTRRGEPRKALDVMAPEARQVVLRLLFQDARYPEFELALFDAVVAGAAASPTEGVRLGRRWLAHIEALMR